jgi:hypothetical protein
MRAALSCIAVVVGAFLVAVSFAVSAFAIEMNPPVGGRSAEALLGTTLGGLRPAGSAEVIVRYTPTWWQGAGFCMLMCAPAMPRCAVLERVLVTNDPESFRSAVFAAARAGGWKPKDGPYPYIGVDNYIDQDKVAVAGTLTFLRFADLDVASLRDNYEHQFGVKFDVRVWRYVVVLSTMDLPRGQGGGCWWRHPIRASYDL